MVIHTINSENLTNEGQRCIYCGNEFSDLIESDVISIHGFGNEVLVHRNCVIAFAARIQNEFEKL